MNAEIIFVRRRPKAHSFSGKNIDVVLGGDVRGCKTYVSKAIPRSRGIKKPAQKAKVKNANIYAQIRPAINNRIDDLLLEKIVFCRV